MSAVAPIALKLQVGARTLATIRRRLQRVPLGLDAVLAGHAPALPPLESQAHGYAITSLPADQRTAVCAARPELIAFERQRYTRYHADLVHGFDAWFASLSGNARSTLKRKAKRLAHAQVERFGPGDDWQAFHHDARAVAATTYQERLLGAGLPDDAAWVRRMAEAGAAGLVRAWLLRVDGRPVAYLYCPVRDGVVLYEYVGHDPALNDLSPGAVLHFHAMRDLMDEGAFRWFDFTEGEGQHKRQLASGGTPCVDLLLLRPDLANRATLLALAGFDGGVKLAKRALAAPALKRVADRIRRG